MSPVAAGTQYVTLTAGTVTNIALNPPATVISVTNRDGAAEVFFTVDGSTPTVGGAGTYLLPAAAGASLRVNTPLIGGVETLVSLISTGGPKIEVDPTSVSLTPGVAAGGGTSTAAPGVFRLEDGTSTNLATIAAFHAADNQALPANSFGLNTGGVAQLLNAAGNIDRQRETSVDNITTAGVATGTAQLASQFSGTLTTATSASTGTTPVVFTPSAMSFPSKGVARTIQVGTVLQTQDATAANQETLYVVAVTATTFSAVAKNTHAATTPFVGFSYNQARDSTLGDGASPGGVPAGTAYFWNQALNSGVGGLEIERSAAGELDGASGAGTAVAAEYEWQAGGPVLASGLASGQQFDRARSVQGKGMGQGTITTSVAGNTTLVFGTAAATNTIQPGQSVNLTGAATPETVYVTQGWAPGSSATVPLVNPVVNAGQTTAQWDVFATQGPGLNGFNAVGVGIEEEALYDPVSKLFYIERSATQDAMPPQNIVAESSVVWNGTNFDRMRSAYADGLATTGIEAANDMLWNGTGFDRARSMQGLATTAAVGRESAHPGLPVFTSLNAAAATANGTALDCVVAHQTITMQLNLTSTTAPTTISTQLQGSLDNVNWFNIGAAQTATASGTTALSVTSTPARYFRAVTTITGGTGVALTALLAVAA